MIDQFDIHPTSYKSKVDDVFAEVGTDSKNASLQLGHLVSEVKEFLSVGQAEHVTVTLDNLSSSKDRVL